MSEQDNEEIIGRRQFFKKAAKTAIPLLAGMAIMPFFSACEKNDSIEDAIERGETGCVNCSSNCSSSCQTSCSGLSTGGGCSYCSNNCSSSCGSQCSSGCGSQCSSECGSGCSSECSNGSNNSGQDSTVSDATGTLGGHGYVDLGLSVKWARCDIQSNYLDSDFFGPELVGNYYAVTKWTDESWIKEIINRLNLWNSDSICGTELDVATQEWGGNWRLPTESEWSELLSNCIITEISLHNQLGLKFTSRINGRSIYMRYSGYFYNHTSHTDDETFYRFSGTVNLRSNLSTSTVKIYKRNSSYPNGTITSVGLLNYSLPIRAVVKQGGSGGCNNSCSNSASGSGCSNCQINCTGDCSGDCTGMCGYSGCTATCGGSCNEKCVSCYISCQNVASGSCAGCTANCSSMCSTTCKSLCYSVSWG